MEESTGVPGKKTLIPAMSVELSNVLQYGFEPEGQQAISGNTIDHLAIRTGPKGPTEI